MAKFDEIWTFLEEKLKDPVPAYIKNILNYCGYNNGISISTIEDNDIQYFIQEVRNGNVVNHFKPLIGEKNVLEGSTKTMQNFEFSRGHLKHLMFIVNFLKKFIEDNGSDCFSKTNYGTKRPIEQTASSSRKRVKHHPPKNDENIKKQKGILLGKTIISVITHSSQIYVEVSITIKLVNLIVKTVLVAIKIQSVQKKVHHVNLNLRSDTKIQ